MPIMDYDEKLGIVERPDAEESTPAPDAALAASEDAQPQQPAQDAEPQQDIEADVAPSAPPYNLKIPDGFSATDLPDGYEQHLADFSRVAAEAGIGERVAQRLLNAMADASTGLEYDKELTGEFALNDAREFILREWGSDAERKMSCVRYAVSKLGPKFAAYLDETGWGNSPAVLEALAFLGERDGVLSLSPRQAQDRIDKIMADPTHRYWTAERGSAERRRISFQMRMLNQIASEGATPERVAEATAAPAATATAQAEAQAARDEARKMLADANGPLLNRGHRDHEAAVRKFHRLTAKLS